MSIARLDNYRTSPLIAVAPVAPVTPATVAPKLVAVPTETEARGFALYVGVDEATAAAAGTNLGAIVAALRATLAELVPGAGEETYAAVALAPVGTGGRNVEVVRTALQV